MFQCPRDTRNSNRTVFKTDSYQGGLYKHSPYFVGKILWDNLPLEVIEMPDIVSFKKRVKGLNITYVNLL